MSSDSSSTSGDEFTNPNPNSTSKPLEDQFASAALTEPDNEPPEIQESPNGVVNGSVGENNHGEIESNEREGAVGSNLEARQSVRWRRTNSEVEVEAPSSPSSSGYAGERGSSSGSGSSGGFDMIGGGIGGGDDDEIQVVSNVDSIQDSQASWMPGKRHVDEDDASLSWRKRKKHFFILSNSGKPIYSRYGDEHKLAGFSATLQAIISFVENGGDRVKLVRAGNHQVVFLVKGPIYLVCISCTEEPYESLRGQLELIYGQMLLILTKSVNRCFEKNPKFDMTPLLGGTDVVFSSLIHSFSWNPATFLHAYTCLPLAYATRQAAGAILQDVADSGVLFAILMCKHKVISLVGAQKASLHPDDMLLLANFVMSSESFRTSESFSPICLPRYNPMAFLYAYVHYLDVDTYLMLLTTSSDAFYHLKDCRIRIEVVLLKSNVLSEVQRSMLDGGLLHENIPLEGVRPAQILLGRDTRPSGESLLEAAKQGISSILGAVAIDIGIVTTPQLHWMVRARNKGVKASELDYFEQLSSSFRCLMDLVPGGSTFNEVDNKLVVDGANGVGGEKLEVLKKMLDGLAIEIRNSGRDGGVLNEGVGADYVQKEKVVPRGFSSQDVGIRCASLDGDADRLVYFSVPSESSSKIDLVDGDKMLSLFAVFIKEQLSILNKEGHTDVNSDYQPRLGVIQTAYANGASTDYLRRLGLEVLFTPTGVKYLHEKAAEYDIGIYFEANGHGTIVFSESFLCWLESRNNELSSVVKGSEQQKAALRLLAVSKLINQAVGDALSGLLLVEVILQHMGWSIHRWTELYRDLPSRQLKVKVVDRTAVVTANAETVAVRPPGIQEAINAETAKYPQGRSFIRPSGTEDVIRVYAEASTQEAADSLANSVAKLVDQFLGFSSS